ncbi:MAG TPA: multidrug efflux SMR transporter [Urbifossiella sp.]|jgi:quaternary ammonium compound-resistance protein SugE|nr:multidrug efflux SMR transporter [Urbifossiella sp.]
MGWLYLLAAGLMELGWPVSVKFAWVEGRLRPGPAAAAVACMLGSMALLILAQRTIPIGTAYAVWTGIGAAGTAALGMCFLDEPATASRILFLGLIVVGVAGLKFTS